MFSTKNKIRIAFFSVAILLNAGLWFYFRTDQKEEPAKEKLACDVHGFRRPGFKFTRPLLMLDRECDDPSLEPLRAKVQAYVDQQKAQGRCENASVYFRFLDTGRNFNINEAAYSPGSMMKIMTLITHLKMAENNPAHLQQKIVNNVQFTDMPHQEITSWKGLEKDKSYTVDQLLNAMIVESDNDATMLLNINMDVSIYNEVLEAISLPIPDPHQSDYPLTTETMSRFFRLLYNATFLSPEMSDKALELLTESHYRQGMVRDVSDRVTVAHKFGEKNLDGGFQLSEGGIFFTGSTDYVLIVMTKGKSQKELQNIIAEVSKLILEDLVANYGITSTHPGSLTDRSADSRVTGKPKS